MVQACDGQERGEHSGVRRGHDEGLDHSGVFLNSSLQPHNLHILRQHDKSLSEVFHRANERDIHPVLRNRHDSRCDQSWYHGNHLVLRIDNYSEEGHGRDELGRGHDQVQPWRGKKRQQ